MDSNGKPIEIPLDDLPKGQYFIKAYFRNATKSEDFNCINGNEIQDLEINQTFKSCILFFLSFCHLHQTTIHLWLLGLHDN